MGGRCLKSRIVFGPNFAATADGCNHRAIVQSSRSRLQRVFSKSPAEGGGLAHTPRIEALPIPLGRGEFSWSSRGRSIASSWLIWH